MVIFSNVELLSFGQRINSTKIFLKWNQSFNSQLFKNGIKRIEQYGQWDGYPTGQGVVIVNFIQNEMDLSLFRSK